MEQRDLNWGHDQSQVIVDFVGKGNRIARSILRYTLHLHIAIPHIAPHQTDGWKNIGTGHFNLFFSRIYLALQQMQLRTLRDVLIQISWSSYLYHRIYRDNLRIQGTSQYIAERKAAEILTILRLLQLIVDLTAFGRDTQQVIGRCHTGIHTDLCLLIKRIHLRLVSLQHTHLPVHRNQTPISIVSIRNHLHTSLTLGLWGCLFANLGQFVGSHDLASRINGLRHGDSRRIHTVNLHGHPVHIHIREDIGTRYGTLHFRQVIAECNSLV